MDDDQRRAFLEKMGYKVAPQSVKPRMREVGDIAAVDYDPKTVKKPDRASRYVDKGELLALSRIFQVTPEPRKPAVFVPPPDETE